MKHINPFELFELNKVGKYYRDNPEKIHNDPDSSSGYQPNVYKPTSQYYTHDYIKKLSLQSGIDIPSLVPALIAVDEFKWSSIDYPISNQYKAILRKLTVYPNNIPKTLWRGLQINVPSDQDRAVFETSWAAGHTPPISNRAASWSTSKSVALSFMTRDTSTDGMRVLLRCDNPSYSDIIADTRQLKHGRFKNENEIIMDTGHEAIIDTSFAYYRKIQFANDDYFTWVSKQKHLARKLNRD